MVFTANINWIKDDSFVIKISDYQNFFGFFVIIEAICLDDIVLTRYLVFGHEKYIIGKDHHLIDDLILIF